MNNQQPYFATYIQDLEQDPFDAVDFVERLAWRMSGGRDQVDAAFLKNKFEEEIGSLQLLSEQFQSKINALEQQHNNEKTNYLDTLSRLQDKNGDCLEKLKQLDGTMQTVSAKVVHLGDQLESVHAPRARAFEALQLMRHFDEFLLIDQPLNSEIFTDPDRLLESAEMIQKLSSISQELAREKYGAVQMRIAHKYDEIEQLLIGEFLKSGHDRKRLREIANILSEFKGFSQCIDAFVERVQNSAFRSGNVFEDILTLCQKANPMIEEIFPNPNQVMAKLILNVFHGKLQETVGAKLQETQVDPEAYLVNLHDLYSKTLKLQAKLQLFKSDADPQFLTTLVRSVFGPYLVTYSNIEKKFIYDQCTSILQRFYESKGHQKRNIHSGGLQDLKRDIQARLLTVENFGGETFLSEEVAINILQEAKNAFTRSSVLCQKPESLMMTEYLYDILLKFLYTNHVNYAIELGLDSIPLGDQKTQPAVNFFAVVQQSSAITHLFVRLFDDTIYPLVKETQLELPVQKRRDQTLGNTEERLNLGMERQLNAVIGYIRHVLQTEQKKADFRPEEDDLANMDISVMSPACSTVVKFLSRVVECMKDGLDGGNLTTILNELGDRLFNAILNHVRTFSYNTTGAMLLLCDINEYKKCVNNWGVREVYKKFESLHALANLLVVVPDNLSEACSSQLLANMDRQLVNSFVQLRHDYKSAKLYQSNF
ncbi:exocyst complex component sec10 domain-containing protein [Ditylenchus destructor]|uniref:Exocyst complex component 5 n=1 Tax=Ditylenchus destructor TaxID=166010 RepID=A0AAD4NG40_9BILA|nr:exocyst complex component sec10 domain-containing protein [Ditylenchus destructor]